MTKETHACTVYQIDPVKVDRVKEKINTVALNYHAMYFKLLSDETRLKIMYALMEEDELCVCEMAEIINGSSATASHHLRTLKKENLVSIRKEGKLAYYSLKETHLLTQFLKTFHFLKEGVEQPNG